VITAVGSWRRERDYLRGFADAMCGFVFVAKDRRGVMDEEMLTARRRPRMR
jgi:hypothetical protein